MERPSGQARSAEALSSLGYLGSWFAFLSASSASSYTAVHVRCGSIDGLSLFGGVSSTAVLEVLTDALEDPSRPTGIKRVAFGMCRCADISHYPKVLKSRVRQLRRWACSATWQWQCRQFDTMLTASCPESPGIVDDPKGSTVKGCRVTVIDRVLDIACELGLQRQVASPHVPSC